MTKLLLYVFLVCIILFFAYINSLNGVESFTPAINRMIRPHVRRVKQQGNQMITTTHHKVRRMVK
jgi:lantibiotic modifying enzyme